MKLWTRPLRFLSKDASRYRRVRPRPLFLPRACLPTPPFWCSRRNQNLLPIFSDHGSWALRYVNSVLHNRRLLLAQDSNITPNILYRPYVVHAGPLSENMLTRSGDQDPLSQPKGNPNRPTSSHRNRNFQVLLITSPRLLFCPVSSCPAVSHSRWKAALPLKQRPTTRFPRLENRMMVMTMAMAARRERWTPAKSEGEINKIGY